MTFETEKLYIRPVIWGFSRWPAFSVVSLFLLSWSIFIVQAVPAPSSHAPTHPPMGPANHRARPSSPLPARTTIRDSSAAAIHAAHKADLKAAQTFSEVIDIAIWWEVDLGLKDRLEWLHEYVWMVNAHNDRRFYRVMSEMSIRRIRTRTQLREAVYRAANSGHAGAQTH